MIGIGRTNTQITLLAKGFEWDDKQVVSNWGVEILSAFEVFEHLDDPLSEITKMKEISCNIFFSTLIYDTNFVLPSKDWWYFAPKTGQHISFYSEKTLKYIAKYFNLKYYRITDERHFFTKEQLDVKKIGVLHEW
ncbi:MAG: methyltransferase domain-containing protein [Enterocloster sp.]